MDVRLLKNSIAKFPGKLSLRTVLIVPLVLQILGIAGLVGYLSFRNGQRAVNELAARLSQETADHVQSYVKNYLETPHLINKANAEAIQLGVLDVFDVKDPQFLERYFTRQLQVFKLVSYISVSNEKGGIIGAGRHNDGRLEVASTKNFTNGTFALYAADSRGNRKSLLGETQNYDTRTRPWYITLAQAKGPAWTEIHTYTDNNVGITAGLPFYDADGNLAGVLTTDLVLSQISVFLQRLPVNESETIFVMERSGLLVASSAPEQLYVLDQNQQADRRKVIESKTPLVRDTARYLMNCFSNFNNINGNQQIDFTIEGQRYFLQLNPLKDGRGIDWLIVVVVPESSFVKQIRRC
jgi:hypothetical protein